MKTETPVEETAACSRAGGILGQNKEIVSAQDAFVLFALVICCLLKGSDLRLASFVVC